MFPKPGLLELTQMSIKSIARNKGRTILTSLGIIIGVTSVILLTAIGSGIQVYIEKQFKDLGSNIIIVSPGKLFNDRGGFRQQDRQTAAVLTFTQKDVKNIEREMDPATLVIPSIQFEDSTTFRTSKELITLVGTTPEYGKARNSLPLPGFGRWFTKEEVDKESNVIVLGYEISNKLFGRENPLGKKIVIKGKTLTVIGTIEKKGGSFGGPPFDDYGYIPLTVAFNFKGNENIQSILIQVPDNNQIARTKKSVEKVLLDKYEKDSFTVFDQTQILTTITGILGTLTAGLTGIAAISLLVGGIGIMNIMLVTVTERTKEIGLRKAIGATPNAILAQFLIEAIILSCLGGTVGVALGSIFSLLINNFFPAQVTIPAIMVAFGVSSAVGIIFGAAPARKASLLSPIEALRYE